LKSSEILLDLCGELKLNNDELMILDELLSMEEDKLEQLVSLIRKVIVKSNDAIKELVDILDKVNDYAACLKMVTNPRYNPEGSPNLRYAALVCTKVREKYGLNRGRN